MKKIPIIIVSDAWLKIVTFGNSWVAGIALWPFVIVKSKYSSFRSLINHEKIHTAQQAEMLVVPFYLWYGIEYLVRLLQYRETHKAYLNICFEREASANERNLGYLETRKPFAFIKYLLIKK